MAAAASGWPSATRRRAWHSPGRPSRRNTAADLEHRGAGARRGDATIVVGLPRNMDGSGGAQAAAARAFGAQLAASASRSSSSTSADQLAGGGAAGGRGAASERRIGREGLGGGLPHPARMGGSTAGDRMTRTPDPRWDKNEQRNARIRELREQRDAPNAPSPHLPAADHRGLVRGVIGLLAVLLFVGLLALSPSLYRLGRGASRLDRARHRARLRRVVPARRPGGRARRRGRRRITVEVVAGANDSEIGAAALRQGPHQQPARVPVRGPEGRPLGRPAGRRLRPLAVAAPVADRGRPEAGGGRGGHGHPDRGLAAGAGGRLPGHHQADDEPRRVRLARARTRQRPDRRVTTSWPTCRRAAAWRATSTPIPTGSMPMPPPGRCSRSCSAPSATADPGDPRPDRAPGADASTRR